MGPTQENKLSSQNTSDKKPVTYCDQLPMPIENRILTLRGKQVMIDRDLAELYGVETKRLNEQVKKGRASVFQNISDFSSQIRRKMNWSQIATGSGSSNIRPLILLHLPNRE